MSATFPTFPKCIAELGAVCQDHGRYALSGICLKIDEDDKAVACVTDGKILVEIELGTVTDCGGPFSVVVDPKLLKKALTACHSRKRDPSARVTEKNVTITGNGAEVVVPLIEGEFPRYEDVIPSDVSDVIGNHSINIAADLLARVCLVLFKACGKGEPCLTFAFHGAKNPIRIDYVDGEFFKGRAVIMPIAPGHKKN